MRIDHCSRISLALGEHESPSYVQAPKKLRIGQRRPLGVSSISGQARKAS